MLRQSPDLALTFVGYFVLACLMVLTYRKSALLTANPVKRGLAVGLAFAVVWLMPYSLVLFSMYRFPYEALAIDFPGLSSSKGLAAWSLAWRKENDTKLDGSLNSTRPFSSSAFQAIRDSCATASDGPWFKITCAMRPFIALIVAAFAFGATGCTSDQTKNMAETCQNPLEQVDPSDVKTFI
ncbi:hypothetical protein [Thermomonas sp. HDW16]|uniref:hypothetical protein n=1 Tax=Thermomonas sp. HDW16 TaxID=2714945 RepID=UPI00140DC704|nr:hypothetical protein [Thermomonas sp. HDW16]QIL21095.1 hypothetical protein G7079_10350 [Thermomonas sp. HDW16]